MADKEEILNEQQQPTEQDLASAEQTSAEQTDTVNLTPVKVKRKHTKAEIALNSAIWVIIAVLLISAVLRLFVFNTVTVSGDSMLPTYESGNIVTVNKLSKPKRGQVAVFYKYEIDSKLKAMFSSPEKRGKDQPYELLIKRVVALEGDKIWIQKTVDEPNNYIYEVVIDTADGNRLFEDYYLDRQGEIMPKLTVNEQSRSGLGNLEGHTEDNPLVVKKGCMYVIGDNRSVSDDSRGELGQVPLNRLFGIVI